MRFPFIILGLAALTACEAGYSERYTPPEASGLIGVRPYPAANSVCMVIGENALTNPYLDDSALLVGCPVHEEAALGDLIRAGAAKLKREGEWILVRVPLR